MSDEKMTPAKENTPGPVRGETQPQASESKVALAGTDESPLDFLRNFRPGGPWVLTSIVPDGKVTTRTFMADQAELLSDWLAAVNGNENVYFHVNHTGDRRLSKKATKEDIVSAEWLHVDVDPLPGKDRAQILAALNACAPAPSIILDSGGGYQAFWRLSESMPATDDAGRNEIEGRNFALARALGGDSCHNIDRIMRLPGTWNLPNKKKLKAGRQKAMAGVVRADWDARHNLSDFERAEVDSPARGELILPEKLPAVDVAALPVSDRCRMLIVQGNDPTNPASILRARKCSGRCCEMARCRVLSEQMVAVIMDPTISSPAMCLTRRTRRSAERQVARAVDSVESEFEVNKAGRPFSNYRNTELAIAKLGILGEHDVFSDRLVLGGHTLQQWAGELSDHACAALRKMIVHSFAFDPGKDLLHSVVHAICVDTPRDPVVEMLSGLRWDGTPRLDTWLTRLLGAEDTPYNRAVGRLLLRGMVERARRPGCKFDYIIVLEGPQGKGKSTALSVLCGNEHWFSDEKLLAQNDTKRCELLQGVWVFELAELAGVKKADVDDLKAFASRKADRYRPAYGRSVIQRPRRGVLVGTINGRFANRDDTGARRFLPVVTGNIDLAGLGAERDQLLAEACAATDPIVLPEELWSVAAEHQEVRRTVHPWEDVLAGLVPQERWGGYDRVSSAWLLGTILGITTDRQTRQHNTDLAMVMNRLGWEGPKPIKVRQGESALRGYARPSERPELF